MKYAITDTNENGDYYIGEEDTLTWILIVPFDLLLIKNPDANRERAEMVVRALNHYEAVEKLWIRRKQDAEERQLREEKGVAEV